MASNYNSLGFNLMTTGENAGTWGTNTNLNLNYLRDTLGYITVAMTADRTLTIPDNSTGTYDGRAFIIECNGALGANRVLDIAATAGSGSSPGGSASILKPFIVYNNTSTAYTLTFKVTGATGIEITQGSTVLCYHNGTDIINTGLAAGDVTLTGTQTLTNKTLTAPKIVSGGFIADAGGDENLVFTEVSTPVNELRITNAATGSGPILAAISTSATDSNIDLNINPLGTGVLKSGTAAVKIAGRETIWIPSVAMYGSTTNPADAQQVETTALRPDLKVLDFDASTSEFAQFAITFPKSWDLGTVTFIPTWSPSNTDTGDCLWSLSGLSVAEGETADTAFSAPQTSLDAGIGTVEDIQMGPESSAITIAGTKADGNQVFFQLERNADDGTDDFTGDARLLGIQLFYTTDAANDA